MSLLEILAVVFLVTIIVSVGVSGFKGLSGSQSKEAISKFSDLVKFTYNESVLTGKVHRISINLDKQIWLVESSEPGMLPVDKTRLGALNDNQREDDRVLKDPSFQVVKSSMISKLPKGAVVAKVKNWRYPKDDDNTMEKGTAFIYAFPSGFIDEATVYLADKKTAEERLFTLTIRSLTGKIKLGAEKIKRR